MKSSTLNFSLLLVSYFIFDSEASDCADGPDPAYCGRPSSIADLVCFLSGSAQPGQSALYIGFDDYITAVCNFYYDCQPSQRAYLNILDVYGYIFNLTYTMKNGTKGFDLYYADMTVPGCPQFQKVLEPIFYVNSYDTALLHTSKPLGVSYYSYQSLYQDTNLSCNTFPSVKVKGDDCSYSGNQFACPVRSPYMFKTPVASLDFSHVKNVALYEDVPQNNQTGGGQTLVDDNGLYATCRRRPNPDVDDDGPEEEVVYCTADRYDNFPFCNTLNERNSLSQVLESYGYNYEYLPCGLNASTACTIATLYAQGFNGENCHKKDYSNCNCNSFTTFVSFGFLLPEFNSQDIGIYRILTKGYCQIGFKQDIMRKFLTMC